MPNSDIADDFSKPLEKISSIEGGVDIKWNDPELRLCMGISDEIEVATITIDEMTTL